MPRELRTSSLYDVPSQPAWLRRLQIVGLITQLVAVGLLWCHLAFGVSWPNRASYDALVFLMLAINLAIQIRAWRWMSLQKKNA